MDGRDPSTGLDPWPEKRPNTIVLLEELPTGRAYIVDPADHARRLLIVPNYGDTELAWAAGVFESEGTVSSARTHGKLRIRAAVTQNGGLEAAKFLERFTTAVGMGKVLGPYDYSSSSLGSKPRWVVQYQSREDVEALMFKLEPYLSPDSPKLEKFKALSEAQREEGGEQPS